MNILNMNIKHENHLRHIHPVRHAKHPKQILQTKHIYNIWFCGGGGGDLAVYVESEYLFPIIYGDNIYFRPTSEQTINFKIEPIWIWWMQDYLFIFLGTQARIFILMCLTVRIFILKKLPAPPNPSQNQLFVP